MDFISDKIKSIEDLEVTPQLHESIMRNVTVLKLRKPFYTLFVLLTLDIGGHLWHILSRMGSSAKYANLKYLLNNFHWSVTYFMNLANVLIAIAETAVVISFIMSFSVLTYLIYSSMKMQKITLSQILSDSYEKVSKITRPLQLMIRRNHFI